MEVLSWFKFCPARWNMGKTKKLSMEERSDYLDLCCAYWVGGCVMVLDEMREHSDNVDLFVKRGLIDNDGIIWLNKQLAEASQKSNQAKLAAAARWGKREQCERNADAMRMHSGRNTDAMRLQCREEERREEREERNNVDDKFEHEKSHNTSNTSANSHKDITRPRMTAKEYIETVFKEKSSILEYWQRTTGQNLQWIRGKGGAFYSRQKELEGDPLKTDREWRSHFSNYLNIVKNEK